MQTAKKLLSVILVLLLVLSTAAVGGAGLALTVSAADTSGQCGDNVYYTYDEESGVLRISGTGEMKGYYSLKSPFYGSDVRFVVVESGVTNIGAGAFNECKSLTNVAIAGSVDWIGSNAFDGCTSLTKISIPNGLTDFSTRVFDNCTALQSVTLPKTMDFIASNILNACSSFQVLNYCGTESDWGEITILNYAFPESLNIQYDYSAAADVEEAIDAIGTVEYSHWCKALIDAAVLAYDALEEDEKSLVKNYGVLQAALAEYARLENGAPVHTVTFDLAGGNINGDTTNPTQTGTVCMPIKPPADPEKEGCSFIGWEPAADVFIPEGGRTYVAQWAIHAADPHRAIWLAADGKADALAGAQQSNIWFGRYKQSSDGNGGFNVEPIKWRVLKNADGQLFVLSDLRLDAMLFFDYADAANLSDPKNCTWEKSIVRSWLNGYPASEHGGSERIDYSANPEDSFIGTAFTSSEQDYIAETLLDNAYHSRYGVSGGPNTTDKIFLLSAGEAETPLYGFTDNYEQTPTRRSGRTDYALSRVTDDVYSVWSGCWWLRSCGAPPGCSLFVVEDGLINPYDVNIVASIRPAFMMNVDSILFTSAAEGGKPAGGSLQEVEKYYGTDWKLTLKDNNHARFSASYVSAENGSCTIRYNNAATGTNEMISAMIVNQYGVVTYYGALCEAQYGGDTVTIDLAGKLNEGDKVYVFNEQRNGDYETDYASALFDVTPTVAPDLLTDKADLKMNLNTNTAQTVWYGDSRWRVIGYDGAGAASESGTMTLFANAGMGTSYFDFDGKTGKQYAGSDLEKQTNQIYNNAFSDPEQLAVRDRTLNAGTYDGANTDGVQGSSVGYARLWPLSTKEANAVSADLRVDTGAWWLRSPGEGVNNVAFVKKEGNVDHIGQSFLSESGVRPAFYVDLGRVLFASAAVGGKQGDGVLSPIAEVINAEWKLTLWESMHQWFTVNETSVTATAGDTVTLHYQYAETGENEYISAIVTDENGKALYYGRIAPATTEDGTVDIALPAALAEGSYTLKVFNEQYNGDKKTDNASPLKDVALTIMPSPFTGEGTTEAPYEIASNEDWQALAQYVANGGTTKGKVYRQTADITVSTCVGTEANPFTGTYDGGGKTLTASLEDTACYVAPFSCIRGATIENLRATGTVKGGWHSAGLVGRIDGTGNLIRNCAVSAEIIHNVIGGAVGYAGGIVGHGVNSETTIEGCVFTGSVVRYENVGALWGWSDGEAKVTIRDCLENIEEYAIFFNPVGLGRYAERNISNVGYRNAADGHPEQSWSGVGTQLYAIKRAGSMSLEFGEAKTFYDVSGIGVYDSGLMVCGSCAFAPANSTVAMTVSYTGELPAGSAVTFLASAGTLTDDALTMPAEDVTIRASVARDSKAIELAANGKAPNLFGAQQSNIWFGNYRQSGSKTNGYNVDPVKWRVLQNKDGKLLLLSDQSIDVFEYNKEETSVTWETSDLRKWLNGLGTYSADSFKGGTFTAAELAAVADSELENADNPRYGTTGGSGTQDKVFLLSIDEAMNINYGFTDDFEVTDTRIAAKTPYVADGGTIGSKYIFIDENDCWRLRSPGADNETAAYVDIDGDVSFSGCPVDDNEMPIRPALHIDLGKVLFTSPAADGKQGRGLTAVEAYDGADWKLTVLDESRADFTASCTAIEGGVYTITYSGAQTGDNEMISAIIVDADGVVTYYGVLENAKAGENTLKLDVSGKLSDGDKLYVFNEQTNGDYKTDYASALVDVTERSIPSYDLWVGGIEVTEECTSGEGWEYAPATNTLTLSNYRYEGEGHALPDGQYVYSADASRGAIVYAGSEPLNLVLEGDNAVKQTGGDLRTSAGLFSEGALTISGTGTLTAEAGEATLDVESQTTYTSGIFIREKLTVTGGTVTGRGGTGTLSHNTWGIYAKGFELSGGEVYAYGGSVTGTGRSIGLQSDGAVTVSGEKLTCRGGKSTGHSDGLRTGSNMTVTGGSVDVSSGDGSKYSYGIEGARRGDVLYIGASVDSFVSVGICEAVDSSYLTVKNELPGKGWKTVDATDDAVEIAVNPDPGAKLSLYKKVEFTQLSFSVSISGENMTKTEDSGDASQTVKKGSAMTAVVYTANDGYYFPEDYATEPMNGVSVTRISFTQITVSGTPTADAAITLPAATVKPTPDMTVTAEGTTCDKEVVITATLPADATGTVSFALKGDDNEYTFSADVKNGKAEIKETLNADDYTITAKYAGDGKYAEETATTTLGVEKAPSEITAETDKQTYVAGDSVVLTITIPQDAEQPDGAAGNVTLKLDGRELTVIKVENGTGTYTIPSVGKGDHTVTAAFNGDSHYASSETTVTFSVGCKHEWKEPTWDWTQDVHNPTYSAECKNCTNVATGSVESKEGTRVEATVDEDAYTPYTAEVKLGEQTFTDTFKAYEKGTAFEKYKQAQKDAADGKKLPGDSDKAAALIEAAKTAIDGVQYNESKTLRQNKDAVDEAANLAQLGKALADRRAADAVEQKIDDIGDVELTKECKDKIDDAREAYDALTDAQKDLVDNADDLTAAEAEYERLDNYAQFEQYKKDKKQAADDKRLPGDSDECKKLIDNAIDAINAAQYNESKTLRQNKDAVDEAANFAQLDADLAEHRAIHYAKFYADGTLVESVPYTIDTKSITAPAVPEKTGYTGAWPSYTLKAGGVRVDAVYETIPYEAAFYADGVLIDTVTYTVETASIKDDEPAVPDKPGHTGAWPEYTLKVGGMRIDAVYEVIMKTVDFDPNGGTGEMESVTTAWGSTVTLPECTFTAPNGKAFDKWDAGSPGDEIEVKSDLTVKAIWKEKPLTLTADVDPNQTGEHIKITVPYARRGMIAAKLTASEEGVYYVSSKPNIISVDNDGYIRLEKLCMFCKTATITAYSASGEKVATCEVYVRHTWWQIILFFLFGCLWY